MSSVAKGRRHRFAAQNSRSAVFCTVFFELSHVKMSLPKLIKIKVNYDYYSIKRCTPFFISEEELLSLSYDEFKQRLFQEVPHLRKLCTGALRLSYEEDEAEVDLTEAYFKLQIQGLLVSHLNVVSIMAVAFDSPAASTSSPLSHDVDHGSRRNTTAFPAQILDHHPRARKTLKLVDDQPMLPLDRYVKKQKDTVTDLQAKLKGKRDELLKLEARLQVAERQNAGALSVCGNCHLKLGHTRRSCSFSPCNSAYSCGVLARHTIDKTIIGNLQKEISHLTKQIETSSREMQNAEQASNKVNNSITKKVEDILTKELPDRYTGLAGRRNWMELNKDVAKVQKLLQGKLPSRENVLKLLSVVTNNQTAPLAKNTTKATKESAQKQILSSQYCIQFPTDDFKLALQLQQEELNQMNDEGVEITSPPPRRQSTIAATSTTTTNHEEADLEFEANAAAALLQLRKR